MELRIQPLEWKRAKSYGIEEIPDHPASPPLGHRHPSIVDEVNSELGAITYIVPRTKEQPYEAAVSADCKLSLTFANTVSLEPFNIERVAEWSVRARDFAKQWGLPDAPSGK